ncbi:MAG: aryl-sulfate sulfotransferase [Candidatus Acidiferrum sp.]
MSKNCFLGRSSSSLCVLVLLFSVVGCSNNGTPAAPAVMIGPNPVTFPATIQGSTSGPTSVTVTNSGAGKLTISSVTIGGTNPADFTNTNTCSGASLAANATCTISVTFSPAGTQSGALSETISLADNASMSPQVITASGTANLISLNVSPPASAIGTSNNVTFSATGDAEGVTYSLAGFTNSGMGTAAAPGSIDASGNYNPPPGSPSIYVVVTATSKTNPAVSASATVNVVDPGTFVNTNNVQVAQYSVVAPSPANISVQFGLTTSYGLSTWTVPTGSLGGVPSVPLYVAGMTQSTPYHMRGVLQFGDGSSLNDEDFTFTTGTLPANLVPTVTTSTTVGMTPQPGIEMVDLIATSNPAASNMVAATDLAGNVIWTYYNPLTTANLPNPIKLMPNGHLLIDYTTTTFGAPDGVGSTLQEVDLGGNLIWEMTPTQLNTALAAAPASCTECNVTVIGTHHDFVLLPNGHLIVIASTTKTLADGSTPTGDVIIDLGDMENVGGNNPNHTPQPVWAWNEFNQLDTNRRPYSYPDWTHTNAVIYSKTDGNLVISIRHQNWLVKIDYNNGAGAGDIIWKMGAVLPGDTGADVADFTLLNADGTPDTTATDWFFAQHGPSYTTTNTSGQFGLTLFDNGDDRGAAVVAGGTCGVAGQPDCYSTVPVFTIDETAKTATFVINPTTPDYSFFGGNAEVLANENVEYDECSDGSIAGDNASIFEVTQTSTPQTVWHMQITGQYAYRAMRIPSLYPGVQW